MSSVNFNDYINYANYDTGYDFSALLGGTTNSSGNMLSIASIKNGSYGKLMKAYYAKQDAESAALSGDSPQKLTLMRSSADSLKKSTDAFKRFFPLGKKEDQEKRRKNGRGNRSRGL